MRVVPYSYTLTPETSEGLDAILSRAYGGASAAVDPPVGWGDDEALLGLSSAGAGEASAVLPLFSLAATPEREAHGAFLDALAPRVALIDESGFLARWPDDAERMTGRRAAWRDFTGERGATAVFIDLASPDLARAEADLAAASDRDAGDTPRGRTP